MRAMQNPEEHRRADGVCTEAPVDWLLSRRSVLAGALALGACSRSEPSIAAPEEVWPPPPLKAAAPFPIGVCAQVSHLHDPTWVQLATAQCSQLTPEWEMKMEYIVQPDGSLKFDRPDELAAFARDHGMRLYGTTLVWYVQKPKYFRELPAAAFGKAYDDYISAVVSRYRGQAVGWDVVNEPVEEDGDGWRPCLWAERLGPFDHMRRAFDQAKAADPNTVLFINEYNLEYMPKKLDTFLRLIERLLASGAPVGGIGCQTHTWSTIEPGKLRAAVQAIARFGLPVHISELDVSVVRGKPGARPREDLLRGQARAYAEAVEALGDLPAKQRFGVTFWGLRDKDSWLVRENGADLPAVFDDAGQPKAPAAAMAAVFDRISR
jgi:endo-1,4-beta-xylanase